MTLNQVPLRVHGYLQGIKLQYDRSPWHPYPSRDTRMLLLKSFAPSGSLAESKHLSWTAVARSFNSVYLLQSVASPTHFYVGCSTNPLHRLRQHNGEVQQGAWKTREYVYPYLCSLLRCFESVRACAKAL